jgi:hypothetical protein
MQESPKRIADQDLLRSQTLFVDYLHAKAVYGISGGFQKKASEGSKVEHRVSGGRKATALLADWDSYALEDGRVTAGW